MNNRLKLPNRKMWLFILPLLPFLIPCLWPANRALFCSSLHWGSFRADAAHTYLSPDGRHYAAEGGIQYEFLEPGLLISTQDNCLQSKFIHSDFGGWLQNGRYAIINGRNQYGNCWSSRFDTFWRRTTSLPTYTLARGVTTDGTYRPCVIAIAPDSERLVNGNGYVFDLSQSPSQDALAAYEGDFRECLVVTSASWSPDEKSLMLRANSCWSKNSGMLFVSAGDGSSSQMLAHEMPLGKEEWVWASDGESVRLLIDVYDTSLSTCEVLIILPHTASATLAETDCAANQ